MVFESSPEFVGADLHFGSEVTSFQRLWIVQLLLWDTFLRRNTSTSNVSLPT